jgi:hypothetical protein
MKPAAALACRDLLQSLSSRVQLDPRHCSCINGNAPALECPQRVESGHVRPTTALNTLCDEARPNWCLVVLTIGGIVWKSLEAYAIQL